VTSACPQDFFGLVKLSPLNYFGIMKIFTEQKHLKNWKPWRMSFSLYGNMQVSVGSGFNHNSPLLAHIPYHSKP